MSFSNYLENELLDHLTDNGAFSAPADIYVKLHLGDPGEAGTSNPAVETTRQIMAFGAASGGRAESTGDVTWTNVSTTETYSHISLWDDPTAGNCLGSGALGSPIAATAGNNVTIPAGDGAITLD